MSLIKYSFDTGSVHESSKDSTQKYTKRDYYLTDDGIENIRCSFCNEVGQSLTNGPNKSQNCAIMFHVKNLLR